LAVLFTPKWLAAWQAEAEAALTNFARPNGLGESHKSLQLSEQFLVLITCRDEKHPVELLDRFQAEGLECKALVGRGEIISPFPQYRRMTRI
jgi:hypothetical protein